MECKSSSGTRIPPVLFVLDHDREDVFLYIMETKKKVFLTTRGYECGAKNAHHDRFTIQGYFRTNYYCIKQWLFLDACYNTDADPGSASNLYSNLQQQENDQYYHIGFICTKRCEWRKLIKDPVMRNLSFRLSGNW